MTTPTTMNKGRGSFAAMYEASRQMSHDAAPRQLRLDQMEPNPGQPRTQFHAETLEELSVSIKTYGLLQPIVVRPHPDGTPGRYQIVAGERRYRACKLAALESVPVVIKGLDDQAAREIALIENLQRENISPLEEAAVLKQILDETNLSHRELGERIGKTKAYVEQRVRLLRYPIEVQAALAASPADGATFSPGHAKAVVQLEETAERQALIDLIEAHGFSVREAEKRVHQVRRLKEFLGEAEQGRKLVAAVLQPAGLSDAAYEAALTVPAKPAAPSRPAKTARVDLRQLGLFQLIEQAQATGEWTLEAEALRKQLQRDLASLKS
jgi:ParB family chromosome partitioning protein